MSSSNVRLYIILGVLLSLFLLGQWIYYRHESITSVLKKVSTSPIQYVPKMSLPSKEQLNSMSESDLFDLYHVFVQTVTYHCRKIVRAGTVGEGGWNICVDPEYVPKKPCVVYSFGIASDSTFDLFVHTTYGCEVHCFDPTLTKDQVKKINPALKFHPIGLSDKNQEISKRSYKTLNQIRRSLGHFQMEISILKLDIETWEWPALKHSFSNRALNDVRQLLIEFHSLRSDKKGHRDQFLSYLTVLRGLQDLGFRAFGIDPYVNCQFQTANKVRLNGCHNIYFVKTK